MIRIRNPESKGNRVRPNAQPVPGADSRKTEDAIIPRRSLQGSTRSYAHKKTTVHPKVDGCIRN
jgi:hypothetical protein